MNLKLPSRHVHLDFHTSEHVPGVGAKFNKKQFQKALKLGRVNYITLFAKCHHSWSYYPTKIGKIHPNLRLPDGSQDLLGQMIQACHEIGVRAPIYYTVGWSSNDAEANPQWCCRKIDGSIATMNYDLDAKPTDLKPGCSWKNLCGNTGYRDLILRQTKEICDMYPVDGMFYDISFFSRCYCDNCRKQMIAEGIEINDSPESVIAATEWYPKVWQRLLADCREVILAKHPNASVFLNNQAEISTPAATLALQTHYELEDLPTVWDGYDKFPLRAKFFLTHDEPAKHIMAMSGKFHTQWGEFGGFKHPEAIRYEAASMIAFGASCSFGDQMHPCGEMDLGTYRNIGKAYAYQTKIASYGLESKPYANLGLWLGHKPGARGASDDDQGVAQMLLEKQIDFEIIHPHTDLSRFETIILSGEIGLDEQGASRLQTYVKNGGSLLILGESALDAQKKHFLFDIGASYLGPANYELDYLLASKPLNRGLCPDDSPFLNYAAALRCQPTRGAKVLAKIMEPYFDRTYQHYCSHQNTCNQLTPASHVGAVQKGKIIFLPHRLGKIYYDHGARIHRDFFLNALSQLHRKPVLKISLPSAGRVHLLHQEKHQRYVAHLLYASPIQRGRCRVIEDMPVLYDVPVELRVPPKVTRVELALTKQRLSIKRTGKTVKVVVPQLQCHQVVVFHY